MAPLGGAEAVMPPGGGGGGGGIITDGGVIVCSHVWSDDARNYQILYIFKNILQKIENYLYLWTNCKKLSF